MDIPDPPPNIPEGQYESSNSFLRMPSSSAGCTSLTGASDRPSNKRDWSGEIVPLAEVVRTRGTFECGVDGC